MTYSQNTQGTTQDGVLQALIDLIARLDAGLGSRPAGVPSSSSGPFYRMGEPVLIPVAPDSAATPVPVIVPTGATTFRYTNNNPFAVRLCGTQVGKSFNQITPTTGWLWLPGTSEIFTSLMPAFVSAMSIDGPLASIFPSQKAGSGTIELQYGTGG